MNGPPDRVISATAKLCAIVEQKIAAVIVGEPVAYAFSAIVIPGENGAMIAAYLLILSMRSPLLTPPRIAVSDVIHDCYPSPEQIEYSVGKCAGILIEARRKLLAGDTSGGLGHPSAN